MPIPTKNDFEKFINLSSEISCYEIWEEQEDAILPEYEIVFDLVTKCLALVDEKASALEATAVNKWFEGQSCFDKSVQSLSRGKSTLFSPEEQTNRLLETFSPASQTHFEWEQINLVGGSSFLPFKRAPDLESRNKEKERREVFNKYVDHFLCLPFGGWLSDVATSLMTYFYGPPIHQLIKHEKKSEKIIAEIQHALQELMEQSNQDTELFPLDHEKRPIQKIDIIKLTEMIWQIKSLSYHHNFSLRHPVKRNDKTIRERFLIYNLWRAQQRRQLNNLSFSKKISVISIMHLLELEGVNAVTDQRTIERLIQDWRDSEEEGVNSRLSDGFNRIKEAAIKRREKISTN